MNSEILKKIKLDMDNFTEKQKKIAKYLLLNYEEAAFLTATQLAVKTETSEPTIIRFSARLGFSKYADMQKELHQILKGKLFQIERLELRNEENSENDLMRIITNSMRTDTKSIEKTLRNLKQENIIQIIEWINSAEKVFVVATHGEYGLACYFAHSLSWIRENVILLTTAHGIDYDQMYNISNKDAIVAISFPPYPKQTISMLQIACKQKAKSIGITDNELSPIAKFSDCCLYAHNEQISFMDNSAPTLSLLSVLLDLISKRDLEKSSNRLKKLTEFWKNNKLYYEE